MQTIGISISKLLDHDTKEKLHVLALTLAKQVKWIRQKNWHCVLKMEALSIMRSYSEQRKLIEGGFQME